MRLYSESFREIHCLVVKLLRCKDLAFWCVFGVANSPVGYFSLGGAVPRDTVGFGVSLRHRGVMPLRCNPNRKAGTHGRTLAAAIAGDAERFDPLPSSYIARVLVDNRLIRSHKSGYLKQSIGRKHSRMRIDPF
jgi:hypothetical protein